MRVLVTYASRHASTREVAERIASRLRESGQEVDLAPVNDVHDVQRYGAVVVGSAIYYGRWLRPALAFVRRHQAALADRPVWLFSSGSLGDVPGAEPAQVGELREAGRPRDHRVFGGALDRDRLGFTERMVVRMVRAPDGDFRRWEEIDAWADSIARQLTAPEVAKR